MKRNIHNIDLRWEMDQIMKDYGHWAVLRQAVHGRLCSCISPTTREALPGCTKCLGSGRAYVDNFVKARKSRPIKFTQAVGGEVVTGPGTATAPEYIFYFKHFTRPTQDDFILELALSRADQQPILPYTVVSVYNITDVRELRMDDGRVEYYSTSAERQIFAEFEVGE